jgi:molecular chaperone GrpE
LPEARRSADEARDQALRTQAELQNFRRRKEREVGARIALANESLILELLPVLDDFERAFGAIPDDVREEHAAWIDGFDLIYRKLQKILENQGLTAIEAAGEFDPNVHEAVTMVPSEDAASGEVVQELRKGYKLKDKVVRASLVSVAQ